MWSSGRASAPLKPHHLAAAPADARSQVAGVCVATPFPRLTYAEAMERYASDKPDLRYGLEMADVTEAVAGCGFK